MRRRSLVLVFALLLSAGARAGDHYRTTSITVTDYLTLKT